MTNEEIVMCIQAGQDKQMNIELLYCQNIGLIRSVVRLFAGIEEAEDLEQQSYFGLVRAAEEWTPEGGANFSTFAKTIIKRELQRYINNGSSIHVPDYKGSLIWKYNKLEEQYLQKYNQKPSDQEVCEGLGITQAQLSDLKTEIQRLKVSSLDDSIETEEGELSLSDTIPDPGAEEAFRAVEEDIFTDQLSKLLYMAMDKLNLKQRKVIDERYMKNKTLQEIAEEQGCSCNTVLGLERRALNNMRVMSGRQLQPFWDEYAHDKGMKKTGLKHFNETWTSATEATALRLLKLKQETGIDYHF